MEEIYEVLGTTGELTDSQKKKLMSLEILTEKENIIPIPRMVNRIRSLRESGKRVVFISDMYFDSSTIRGFLARVDSSFQDIPLYVSNEYGFTKNSGNLYSIVKDIEKVSFKDWIHIGDNLYSDVQKAKSLGINAQHFEFSKLTAYELDLLREYGNFPEV